MFGAALYRLRQRDFGELRHHDGISPAWPITYEELEPYYAKAERMYHVHGLRGRDPTEPPASGPYPCAPVSDEPRIRRMARALADDPSDRSTLAQWADRMGMSERSLTRPLVRETGLTSAEKDEYDTFHEKHYPMLVNGVCDRAPRLVGRLRLIHCHKSLR